MRLRFTSVFVDNQDKALKFYTEILGFIKKTDITAGEYRWLTVVSPEEPEGTELLLQLNDNPAAKTFQKALYDQRIPLTVFVVDDIQKEYERMKKLGVKFTQEPTRIKPTTFAVFEDTCGNLIQILQYNSN
jgi:catechol 2,3-dioxygenase-like lactoylglutathione lyase family enzyme